MTDWASVVWDAGVLVAQAAEGGGGPTGGLFQMLPLLVMMVAIFYFLLIRPQQQRDKERKTMLESLAKGEDVVTTGGICGSIEHLSEHHVVLRVDNEVTMKFVKSAIHQVLRDEAAEPKQDKSEKKAAK